MTTMPEVTKPPPRAPAAPASTTGNAAQNEPDGADFASLLGEGSPEIAKGQAKAPRPDAAAITTTTDASDTAEPVIVWLAAPLQPAPLPNSGGLAVAAAPTEEATGALTPEGQATDPALPPTNVDGSAAAAATPTTVQPPLPSANDTLVTLPAPAQAEAAPTVPLEPPPPEALASPPETRRSAKTAGRTADATANLHGQDGGKPDPTTPTSPAPAARGGQPLPNHDGAPQFPTPTTTGTIGDATPSGLDALPTLPGQAASHYAAAASSGRAAGVAHSPAMAQVTAPLIRVAEAGGGAFHIDLTPVELGRIRVVADINDGQVSLSVQAEHADTLALLRRDVQQLEKALGDAGLKLDNANLQFSLQGDGQSRGSATPDQGGSGPQGNGRAPAVIAALEPTPAHAPRPIDGLVDVTI